MTAVFLAGILFALPSRAAIAGDIETSLVQLRDKGTSELDRRTAIQRLIKSGKEAVQPLADVVAARGEDRARIPAILALQSIIREQENRDGDTRSIIERLVTGADRRAANTGVGLLMFFQNDEHARETLEAAVRKQTDDLSRGQMLSAVAYNTYGLKSQIPYFQGFLADQSEYVKVSAAGHLGALGDKSGLALCLRTLQSTPAARDSRRLLFAAVISAGKIGDPSLLPPLRAIAGKSDAGRLGVRAHEAIKEIEFAGIEGKSARLTFLQNALNASKDARWAAEKLMFAAKADRASLNILRDAARNPRIAGSAEAARALAVVSGRTK